MLRTPMGIRVFHRRRAITRTRSGFTLEVRRRWPTRAHLGSVAAFVPVVLSPCLWGAMSAEGPPARASQQVAAATVPGHALSGSHAVGWSHRVSATPAPPAVRGTDSAPATRLVTNSAARGEPDADTDRFLDWFWQRPIVTQNGPRVAVPGMREHLLSPERCGACHWRQLGDWTGSRHARAMGAGVLGQLLGGSLAESRRCLVCHAPLEEQAASLAVVLEGGDRPSAMSNGPGTQPSPHQRGVMCSVCHVRGGRWFGPPKDPRATPRGAVAELPHAGWTAAAAFEDSRFCAVCHQFPDEGYELNGKLLENTYEEWRNSSQARTGLTCQGCHMPGRRHLWRGIHDPSTVRSGVTIEHGEISMQDGRLAVGLWLINSGTGHFFPTYVTPNVLLEAFQEDAAGRAIAATRQDLLIARDVSLDLATEYADTRVAPGQRAILTYSSPRAVSAVRLAMRVRVEPDAFYARFFEALLASDAAEYDKALIEKAWRESKRSGFVIFEERLPFPKASR